MSKIGIPEAATTFGALDAANLGDGDPLDAWSLRTMARSSNLLIGQGEPALNLVWSSENVEALGELYGVPGALAGFGYLHWYVVLPPLTVPKRPGLSSFECAIMMNVIGTDTVEVQIGTNATGGLDPLAGESSPNVIVCTPASAVTSFLDYSIKGIPATRWASHETISIAIRGRFPDPIRVPSIFAPGGGSAQPTTAAIEKMYGPSTHVCSIKQWASVPSWPADLNALGRAIRVVDAPAASGGPPSPFSDLWAPRSLIGMGDGVSSGSSHELVMYPGIDSASQAAAFVGKYFEICEVPRWQICNLALWTEDRF